MTFPTDADREAVAEALRKSRLTWGTHSDRWGDAPWQRDFWGEAADVALAALTPLIAARERQAAAERDAAVARAEAAEATVARVEALVKEWADADEGYTGEAAYFARRHATHLRAALDGGQP